MGGYCRLPEGDRRRARGDLDDHAQLDRDLDRVFLFGLGGPLQNDRQPFVPVSNDIVDGAKLPVFWGDPVFQGLHVGFFVAIGGWTKRATPKRIMAGVRLRVLFGRRCHEKGITVNQTALSLARCPQLRAARCGPRGIDGQAVVIDFAGETTP